MRLKRKLNRGQVARVRQGFVGMNWKTAIKWIFILPRRKKYLSLEKMHEATPKIAAISLDNLETELCVLQGHPDQQVRVKSSRVHTTRVEVHSGVVSRPLNSLSTFQII